MIYRGPLFFLDILPVIPTISRIQKRITHLIYIYKDIDSGQKN